MEFNWTDDQNELRRGAIEFARERLVTGAGERDRAETFSRELWDACADFGLHGVLVPEAWDGGGHDLLTAVAIFEGVGYGAGDQGLVFSVAAHVASSEGPLLDFGNDAQKAEWLPGLADGSHIGATGITEPDSGSNAMALASTAQRDGDRWLVNGTKTFVTNAPVADLFVVYARTGQGFGGLSCFLVPADTDGLTVGPPMEKMGLRTSPIAQIYLDDCRLPASALVGEVGSGAMIFHHAMDVERLLVMAPAVGAMERLLERCVAYARQRTTGSSGAIGKNQAISHRIADMELRLDSSRLLLYRAAWQRQHRGKATRESALAKLAVSEAYVDCCRSAMQIFGGYGYMVDTEIERELRDALATTLYVGTSEIQRNLIAGLRGLG